jgi:serine O-acetyltransferase
MKPELAPIFVPYGTPCDDTPDPVACKLDKLGAEMEALRGRVAELEHELEAARAPALGRRQA